MERAEVIDPGFIVADAGSVSFSTSDADLLIEFSEWNGKKIKVTFEDAIAHLWDRRAREYLEGERYDSTHVIHESEWLAKHSKMGYASVEKGFRHFRLNFNAEGTLEVIAKSIRLEVE